MALKDKKWFQAIMKIAPAIGSAVGGPFVGAGLNALKEALGLPEGATEDDIEAAMEKATPQDFINLKAQEQKFIMQMEELGIKREELEYQDISDARARQVSTKDWTPAVLTGVALTFFFLLSYSVLTNLEIVNENQAFVMFLFGSASTWVTQGMSFFLGSSRGSQRKTDILANGTKKPT